LLRGFFILLLQNLQLPLNSILSMPNRAGRDDGRDATYAQRG